MRRQRSGPAPVDFDSADQELGSTLESLDGAANYAAWIFDLVRPHLGDEVLELGAGHGTFTALISEHARRVVAEDLSPRCAEVLRERFAGRPGVEVSEEGLEEVVAAGPFDSAVLINVLEHIPDDDGALRTLYGSLKPGGRLVLWVPAFQLLYSEFDRKVGHHRRYRREGLKAQIGKAGFDLIDVRYVNAVGGLAWLVVARCLGRTPTESSSVKLFDRIVPALEAAESRLDLPFGQSLFVVASRPGAGL